MLTGTLQTLPALAAAARLVPPTLIIVGSVVSLRDKLSWFDTDGMQIGSAVRKEQRG